MATKFRNALTTVPGVTIGVGRLGLNTTVRWDYRSDGPLASTPGATSSRGFGQGASLTQVGDRLYSGPLPTDPHLIPGTRIDFGSGHVSQMTSPGLDGFKSLLIAARQRERQIRADVAKARLQLGLAWAVNALGWATLAAIVAPPVKRGLGSALAVRRAEIGTLRANLEATRIKVDFDMESEVAVPYRRMQAAFDDLSHSQRLWSVATEQSINRVKARSFAGTVISKVAARMWRGADALVDTTDAPLAMSMLGGKSTIYVYPGFALVATGYDDFALLDFKDLEVSFAAVDFTETDVAPTDAATLGKTWAKANKNGSRDKRFANNRELPILRYGQLRLSADGGLNESYMFSRAASCHNFAAAIGELRNLLISGGAKKLIGHRQQITKEL